MSKNRFISSDIRTLLLLLAAMLTMGVWVFATGPGGVWVFSPEGIHLGTIMPDEYPANVAWGDDGQTLYMTAQPGRYRVRLMTDGPIPGP